MGLQSGTQWRPEVPGNGDMEAIAIALRWEQQALPAQCNRRMVSCYLVSSNWFWRLRIVGPDFCVSLDLFSVFVRLDRNPSVLPVRNPYRAGVLSTNDANHVVALILTSREVGMIKLYGL